MMDAIAYKLELANAEREYHPCRVGVHVCGQIEDENGFRPYTVSNMPCRTFLAARALFDLLSPECERCAGEPDDLMVDLFSDYEMMEDQFLMSRQMLSRALSLARTMGGTRERK